MEIKEARRIAKAHNNGTAVVAGLGTLFAIKAQDVLAHGLVQTTGVRKLGTDDSYTSCDLCGKSNLKHTVVFARLDGDEDMHLGTDCAESVEFYATR